MSAYTTEDESTPVQSDHEEESHKPAQVEAVPIEEDIVVPQTLQIKPTNHANTLSANRVKLPWGGLQEKMNFPHTVSIESDLKPGEFVLQTLFAEFTICAERKIERVLTESLERPLAKSLQRGEDAQFDQLLSSLSSVAEHCLPSLLKALFLWYDRQNPSDGASLRQRNKNKPVGKDYLTERRDLALDFVFCLVLIDVLKQLAFHPGHDELINHILTKAFKNFKYKEGMKDNPNTDNINMISDLYAEVIGVLAQSRFHSVRKKFMIELRELRSKEQNPITTHSIIGLMMALKFFRVKMVPIEEFEACISFLQEFGHYFTETRDKDVKHAMAGLFVEILLPVAAVVKNEVNVPVLKNLVDYLYPIAIDMTTKKKHTAAMFPLVTCLLCISTKTYFLNNWPYFLGMCLQHLRNRSDNKMSRVALESLYRLLWVYCIRLKCESNSATLSKLQAIVSSLFPKGSKLLTPKDTPLNIFVKIIQFIAKERLDFAMRDIVFDLLCVGRQIRQLTPERMSVGLRAFLVVADSLQQKEGEPPMPQSIGVLPSGSTVRVKKTFLNKMLSESTAKSIGVQPYYTPIRKIIDSILRVLDFQVCRPMSLNKPENLHRELDEVITGDKKAKLDLCRICIAAIPRLLPDGMSKYELVDFLARQTLHMDEELRGLAFQALQNLVVDLPDWRPDVLKGFIQFIQREINDAMPHQLDGSLKMLIQLLTQWKTAVQSVQGKEKTDVIPELSTHKLPFDRSAHAHVLNELEGFAIVMMCHCKSLTRKLSVMILKEIRNLFNILGYSKVDDPCVIDIIDKCCPAAIETVLQYLPAHEKSAVLSAQKIDLQWLADRTSSAWLSGFHSNTSLQTDTRNITSPAHDPWIACFCEFLKEENVLGNCPNAVSSAWPIIYTRLNNLFAYVDPSSPLNDTKTSGILRSGSKKVTNERDLYINLWHNYVVFSCCIAISATGLVQRCSTPDLSSSPDSGSSDGQSRISVTTIPTPSGCSASNLFKLIVPLIRCETQDIRDTVVNGIGRINRVAFRDLMEELIPIIKEVIDRKQENKTRRRRRDALRAQLAKIFELMAECGTFSQSITKVIDNERFTLSSTFVEYIDGARIFLENEGERDQPIIQEIRLHYSGFINQLIRNMPLERRKNLLSRDLRYSLFYLFAGWSGKFGQTFGASDRRSKDEGYSDLELTAVQAMSSVLCCGSAFDPSGLNDEGYVYSWLDTLLGSHDDVIYKLAQETVVLLLEFNPDSMALLDWVIDRCYTGSSEVADGCFNALATVFNNREYPCDHVAMLNVTLLNTGCPRIAIHETALQLLQLLDKRFFYDEAIHNLSSRNIPVRSEQNGGSLKNALLSATYSQSQMFLSEQLAKLHPDLTMPMFSEITQRFQTARTPIRQVLLTYLIPWLNNIELVDNNLQPGNPLNDFLQKLTEGVVTEPTLKGVGWGSQQGSEMVLNNLFYVTVKFGDDHPKEIEKLWETLVHWWPNNLRVIIRYLLIMTNMAPTDLLPYAKRVIIYLARAKTQRLVDEIMLELQTYEGLPFNIERQEPAPFFRLVPFKKVEDSSSAEEVLDQDHPILRIPLEKGLLHTKRHSTLEGGRIVSACQESEDSHPSVSSSSSGASLDNISERKAADTSYDTIRPGVFEEGKEGLEQEEGPTPYPLPMPAYGGFWAPMPEFLPDSSQLSQGFHRCNLAVMYLTDLVVDGLPVDWGLHLPTMLHIIFLGLDNTRAIVTEYCKKLLLNLLLVLSIHTDHFSVAKMLLTHKALNEEFSLTLPPSPDMDFNFFDGSSTSELAPSIAHSIPAQSTFSINSTATITPDNVNTAISSHMTDVEAMSSTDEVAKALIEYIATRKGRPMWNYEDVTSRLMTPLKSAELLENFQKHVLKIFQQSQQGRHLEQRWAQVALQLALSCSSRHYAGRSLQVFRSLKVPLTTRMLSDILSRLVETVAEQGEDMQGYVTEIMLTLEAAVDNIDTEFKPIELMKEMFLSTPNLRLGPTVPEIKKSTTVMSFKPNHHNRSTSVSISALRRTALAASPLQDGRGDSRPKSTPDSDNRKSTNMTRSRSAQSLKQLQEQPNDDDKLTILTQMFWLGVCLLESDYDYEFLLAIRFLEKILQKIQPDRPECREKLDKIQQQIKWPSFPGMQALLLKGCTISTLAENTWGLLSRLTQCINSSVIDPSQGTGFPLNVICLLPYMVQNYEQPNTVCIEAAERIAQACQEQSRRLDNLASVMRSYSLGTFNKDSLQWTKCVVKYLYDVYENLSAKMMNVLVEILEKGPASTQSSILQILHCMLHYVDINSLPKEEINDDLFRVVSKYVEGQHWKEALKILKLAVTKSSSLTTPPPTSISSDSIAGMRGMSFVKEVSFKKELPGRTLDFTFDVSQTVVIGRKIVNLPEQSSFEEETIEKSNYEKTKECQVKGSISQSQATVDNQVGGWKRPHLSQARTRERFVNLLTCYGQRVGLPKSPSVIFSQTSDTLERQASMCSSSDETSNEANSGDVILDSSSTSDNFNGVIKEFDFLDKEMDNPESLYDGPAMFNYLNTLVRNPRNQEDREDEVFNELPPDHTPAESSEDEESGGSHSPVDDMMQQELGLGGMILQNPTVTISGSEIPSHHSPLSHSESTHSLHSTGTEQDPSELSPSNASPIFSHMAAAYLSIHGYEIEEIWQKHVSKIMIDCSGSEAVNTYAFFVRLYKETRRKLTNLTKQACYYLSKTEGLRTISTQFLSMLEVLLVQAECPHVYTDVETLTACKFLCNHRFCVMEINETYETYLMKREQAIEVLENIKSSVKLQSLGENVSDFCGEEQKIELCRYLYKLHFQLLLLFESFTKMVRILSQVTSTAQIQDMSGGITSLQLDLNKTLIEIDSDQASPFNLDLSTWTKEEAEERLVEYIHTRQYTQAVMLIRALRSLWRDDVFGVNSDDDIPALLSIFCKHLADKKSGILVITQPKHDLSDVYNRLMDINMQIAASLRHFDQSTKVDREVIVKRSESSIL